MTSTPSTAGAASGMSDPLGVIDLTGADAALAAGMPDPATLAKMAAEYYGVLSRSGSLGVPGTDAASIDSVTAAAGQAAAGTMPASTMGIAPSVGAMTSAPTSAAMPSLTNAAVPDLSSFAGLGFLNDIRGLDSLVRTVTDVGVAPAALAILAAPEQSVRSVAALTPAVPGVQAIPAAGSAASMAGAPAMPEMSPALPFGISVADIGSPQLPSAASSLDGATGGYAGAMSMTEMLRPLDAFGVSPTLAPIDSSLSVGGMRAADISSIPFDVQAVRRDFPILGERVNGRQLIWLDNAATTQKPRQVIDRLRYFYEHENSNVHRAAHTLAARATDAYEAARDKVRRFLNASSVKEIIFVRGTTEGINLVASSWGRQNIHAGDEIVITHLEHHANIVPWQTLCAEKGAKLRVAPVDDTGQVILEEYEKLFNSRTRLAAFSHVSNALGTVTPAREMIEIAHRHGAKALLDGAQSVSHMQVDVQSLDCDFFVFSGHKLFAPTGIGAVFGKSDILEHTQPYQGGGNMIADVTFEKTLYHGPPVRFEAGTGNIADAVGLGAAIDYVQRLGLPTIARYEHDLLVYGTEVLKRIPGVKLIGTAKEKASVLSFVLDGYKTEEVGQALGAMGIAVRSGHHCAQPILRRFGTESTVRPSLAFYNTCEEIDELAAAIRSIQGGRPVRVA